MTVTEHELEERAVAPRVTLDQVNDAIQSEFYFTAADGIRARGGSGRMVGKYEALEVLTFCVLVLKNGFTCTGQSACADIKNYQEDIGNRIARQDAVNKIWPLLGYELRSKLDVLARVA